MKLPKRYTGKLENITLDMVPAWTSLSCHCPGNVKGNLNERIAPLAVPANNILPE